MVLLVVLTTSLSALGVPSGSVGLDLEALDNEHEYGSVCREWPVWGDGYGYRM